MLLTMRRSLWFAEQSLPDHPTQNAGKLEMEHQRLSSQNACDSHRCIFWSEDKAGWFPESFCQERHMLLASSLSELAL